MKQLAAASVMIDIEGKSLTDADRRRLMHPLTGGVILFARNYESTDQLVALTGAIRALRQPPLLIGVDHEGGRVQRFRSGFTALPPMRVLGKLWDSDHLAAQQAAEQTGYLIAREVSVCGIDFSFAPVLDLDYGRSAVIGDRALHRDPEAVAALGAALISGLRAGGVVSVGKHFPGHGYVEADSHHAIVEDLRSMAEIESADLIPFARLVANGLAAVMPAHVRYPAVDDRPAGFSPIWLKDILRGQLGFQGVIFSDDLAMEGAGHSGDITARALAALAAGCDIVLVCNRPDAVDALLEELPKRFKADVSPLLERLYAKRTGKNISLLLDQDARYAAAKKIIEALLSGQRSPVA